LLVLLVPHFVFRPILAELAAQEPPKRIPLSVLQRIDDDAGLSKTGNCELRMAWTTVAVLSGLPGSVENARDFLVSYGRMKYARPLLALLAQNADGGRDVAIAVIRDHASWYHPICGNKLRTDLVRLLELPARSPSDTAELDFAGTSTKDAQAQA